MEKANPPKYLTLTNIESRIVSDSLNAELSGKPLSWPRYRADYPKRRKVLDQLFYRRFVGNENNLLYATFKGLIHLHTPIARKLQSNCGKIYRFMVAHHQEHLYEQIPIEIVADRIGLDPSLVIAAVTLMQRGTTTRVSSGPPPLTLESLLTGHDSLLDEPSFRKFVRKTQEEYARYENHEKSQAELVRKAQLQSNTRSPEFVDSGLTKLASDETRDAWERCLERCERDPEAAITAAKSLLESACKQILDSHQVSYSGKNNLNELYRLVAKTINLDATSESTDTVKRIFGACTTLVNGLAELRNTHGDSHGKAPGTKKPGSRHSKLAVRIAGAVADFILTTDEGRRGP